MAEIKRIYVEKKEGCNIEASQLLADIKENLGLTNLTGLRILNRYDVEDIADDVFEAASKTIFSEPPVDYIYNETFEMAEDETAFSMEYLPGQYDQRADSAMQCIQIISGDDKAVVASAKTYVLKGKLSTEDVEKIKHYCINPVDSREASMEKPATLKMDLTIPTTVETIDGFVDMDEKALLDYRKSLGLAMSEADIIFCQKYFRDTEKRNPTITEIRVIDTYWSDHCRHTTFATHINDVTFEDGKYKNVVENVYKMYLDEKKSLGREQKPVCLMDIATTGMRALRAQGKLDNFDESEEINACSIVVPVDVDGVEEDWLVMFKNETHNHPTEIEPFGGAATCLGGAIRDPLSGRSYVYQAMRVTGAGDPTVPVADTLQGKLPQRKIVTSAAHGYSSYGNQIGLATGQVAEIYDEGYVAKRMEIGAVIAAAKKENVIRERPDAGDIIILTGGRTGRDGCGGATGSSKEHNEDSILTCGAEVQKGNAPTERKLQRLFRNPEVSKMIRRCNDFGAGGVSVAIGELADGLEINLDLVPKKYEGLDGTELAISESQERMAVVVKADKADSFIKYANEENLEATVVAKVTDDRRLKMFWNGNDIVNISRDFLDTNGAVQNTDIYVEEPANKPEKIENKADLKAQWLENLSQLNVACQKGLVERFDSTIGAGTILMPFGGKNQMTPAEVMAAKIPLLKGETTTGTLMSYGYNPTVAKWSPFHSAVYAVVESVAKIVAGGGDYDSVRLTFQEYFERLGEDSHRWGKPFSALLGAYLAQIELGTAAIGGKDSMSGTFKDLDVPPTLVSFAVDPVKMYNVISPEFKNAGNTIVKVSVSYDENDLPVFDELKKNFVKISELVKESKIVSAATIGVGGIAAAVTKMAFGNDIGAVINEEDLFNYNYGSFVLELACDKAEAEKLFAGYNFAVIGHTTSEKSIVANGVTIDLDEALNIWIKPLEKIFPTKYLEEVKKADIEIKPFNVVEKKFSGKGIAAPRVLIPVFPGNNCEYDTKRAFEKAGAVADTLVVTNLKTQWLEESIDKMVDMIHNSQIIMIPGGFSAGDEPEGSGKFIAAVFRNPKVKEAVMDLLKNRDGLMLGICNGFQALIKLGLVPFGEIRDMEENSPTLTFNTIGRHISCLADTKIVSNKSPWLWNSNVGDIHKVAFSHGEGRFMAEEAVIKALAENNQIATQYVDPNGNPTFDIRYNPNGSLYAIEGITSPDGRVLGKMGHSERIGNGVFKNVPGEKDQKIFLSGVQYFK
ncbi:MAG: phosphoribosylformylglycinamidine synthase [Clostridia bacterium]|jgi:phosphoribosylformylglycinamidine synthase|nr:phosphoribosylformylglycinamidine synthase [Clostridia bacterium]